MRAFAKGRIALRCKLYSISSCVVFLPPLVELNQSCIHCDDNGLFFFKTGSSRARLRLEGRKKERKPNQPTVQLIPD